MKAYIHHIETLVPRHGYAQNFIGEKMAAYLGDPAHARITRHVFRRSGIERRYSVLPDFAPGAVPRLYRDDPEGRLVEPTTGERNRIFIEEANQLSVEVARRALQASDRFAPADITHVVTVSCTGFYNPGPDFRIVNELGLSPATERYHLGFMGCYAAFPALRMAQQFCLAQPEAVVLVVCLELCTLHLQVHPTSDSILANAIFADGVAAAIVSARPPSGRRPVLAIDQFMTALLPEAGREMAWEIGDHGFNLVLSSYVPDIIGANVGPIVEDLLGGRRCARGDVDLWAVHPGGKAILDKVESFLELRPEQLADSRAVLRDYGNMSSATVLFVLRRMLQGDVGRKQNICAMAFGPGLVVETGLLELQPAEREIEDRWLDVPDEAALAGQVMA